MLEQNCPSSQSSLLIHPGTGVVGGGVGMIKIGAGVKVVVVEFVVKGGIDDGSTVPGNNVALN